MGRVRVLVGVAALTIAVAMTSTASGYIHVPPLTLKKMCDDSGAIRVLTVEACNKDKGVVTFEVAEAIRAPKSGVSSFRLVIRPEAPGGKPILESMVSGKTVVLFSSEGDSGKATRAIGYAFIDENCYSVDYNAPGEFWLLLRAEPQMSACYYGKASELPGFVRAALEGKEIKVPTKAPAEKVDHKSRVRQVEDAINKNQANK